MPRRSHGPDSMTSRRCTTERGRSWAPAPRAGPPAARVSRSSSVSANRGGRHGPPPRPSSSIAALKYWTSFGVMSSRASGSSSRVERAGGRQLPGARQLPETHALVWKDIGDARDPARSARAETLERPIVAADHHVDSRTEVDELGDPPGVAEGLLERDDARKLARELGERLGPRSVPLASGLL